MVSQLQIDGCTFWTNHPYQTPGICISSFRRQVLNLAFFSLVTRQHQAVEAGAPFEQLIKAGIRTAQLDKILRQRTNLKKPVELLSQKEVLAAVNLLESHGRITEISDDLERLKAIACDYVNNPKGTLIISPANSERVVINSIIHHQLQASVL